MNKEASKHNHQSPNPGELTEEVKKQILAIRDIGQTNMFNISNVMRMAIDLEFYELVAFLCDRENRTAYGEFILYGNRKQL